MEFVNLNMQYGHADGHTSVCFTSDGKKILTCGSDGDVRIWESQDDGDPSSECVGELALSLAFHCDHFYVGSDSNYVQSYTYPEAKRDGIISRFTAPVTHIAIAHDGTTVAAGSCDMEIQVADTENANAIVKMLGHTAPITGVAIDPLKKFLASSSCDGSIKIWNLSSGELIKTLPDLLPRCNDFFRALVIGRPSWQSGLGEYLAIPVGKQVRLYSRETWSATINLTDSKVASNFSIVEYSPCSKYIAASTTSGELFVWDVNNAATIASFIHPKSVAISCLAWRPDSQALALCDRLGQFAILDDFVVDTLVSNLPDPASPVMVDDDDDNNDDNEISIDEIKRSAGWGSPKKSDDASSIPDEASVAAQPILPFSFNLQPSFQPSSTPIHFQHRFMVWNSVGIVRCFSTEDEIDVEFHDTMFHHGMHMNNYDGFTMASLSSKVLALASDSQSKLTCVLLNAWDGSKEWSISMPENESITAVATSGKWVAVSTDSYNLRLFSYTGTQRQIISVPGQVVCLAGQNNKLGIIYHQGLGMTDSQNLAFVIYEIEDLYVRALTTPQPLPITPKTTIKWAGFTDEGRLCSFDSFGVLRCLGFDSLHWTVLTDTRFMSKGASDNYFVLGVSERYQNIRCVLCKGSFYPMTTPRPTVVEIPLKLPICEPDVDKSSLEEVFWRLLSCLPSIQSAAELNPDIETEAAEIEKNLKQTVIKLFANACKGDLELRATEVASLMPEQPLQMAAKYASKCGKMHLAQKLSELNPVDWTSIREIASSNSLSTSNHHEQTSINNHMVNSYGEASQRDIFEEIPTDNKLVQAENHESPMSMTLTPSVRNPFKIKDKVEKGPKGLSFFDKPVLPKSQRNEPIKNSALTKKVAKINKTEKSSENSQPKKQTFMLWFSSHKSELTEEFPDLTMGDLTKKAMGRFREECQQSSLANKLQDTSNSQDNLVKDTQKRKLEDDDSQENAKKVATTKLSAFAFKESH